LPILDLTEKNLRRLLKSAEAGEVALPETYWTPERVIKGLAIRVNRDLSLSWIFKGFIGGKQIWKKLGTWPEMSTKAAQEALEDWRSRKRRGENPDASRLTAMLWEHVVDQFEREHLPNVKPKTRASYASALRVHLRNAFAGKLASEIDEADVRTFHQTLGNTGKVRQANVCLMLLRVIFDRCEGWRYRPMNTNPVAMLRKTGYKTYREDARDRPLDDDEVTRFGEALVAMEEQGYGQFCDFVRVLYFSGARRGEVLGLAWEWIDEKRKVISWPDTKTGATSKPLNDALFEVLARIPRIEGNPWVFMSQGNTPSESGHLEEIKRPWKKLMELAKIEGLTRHDLRHNVGNVAADEGENLQTVAALLGHRQTATTERYSKTRGLAASNRVGAKLKGKLGGKK
jgi:integrase